VNLPKDFIIDEEPLMSEVETIKEYILQYIKTNGHIAASIQGDDFNLIPTGAIDSIAMFKFMSDIERRYEIERL
jgi:acyl carrier protein